MPNHLSLIIDGKHIEFNEYPKARKTSQVDNNVLKKYVGSIPDIFIISQSVDSDVL